MNRDELFRLRELIDIDYIEIIKERIPKSGSEEFFKSYAKGMQDVIELIKELKENKFIDKSEGDRFTGLLGVFLVASGEKYL